MHLKALLNVYLYTRHLTNRMYFQHRFVAWCWPHAISPPEDNFGEIELATLLGLIALAPAGCGCAAFAAGRGAIGLPIISVAPSLDLFVILVRYTT